VVLGSVWAEAERHPAEADQAGLASLNLRDVREAASRKNPESEKKRKISAAGKRVGKNKQAGNNRKKNKQPGKRVGKNKQPGKRVGKNKQAGNNRKKKLARNNRKKKLARNNRKKKLTGNNRKKKRAGKSRKNKQAGNNECLEDKKVRDYRFSLNQRRKAIRIQKIIKTLQKKVNNSKSFFIEGTMFFKDCAAGKTVFDSLSKCNQTASTACDTSDVIQFNSVLYNRLDQCIENLDTSINSINDCIDINAPICAFIPPDKNCNFNRFENEVKDVRDNCVNPQKNGSFAFCTRLLKDSYDIALLCCGKTTTGSSTTTATTTAITTTTTVTTVTRRTKREIRIDVINQLRGHHFFNSYQKN